MDRRTWWGKAVIAEGILLAVYRSGHTCGTDAQYWVDRRGIRINDLPHLRVTGRRSYQLSYLLLLTMLPPKSVTPKHFFWKSRKCSKKNWKSPTLSLCPNHDNGSLIFCPNSLFMTPYDNSDIMMIETHIMLPSSLEIVKEENNWN